MLPTPNFLLGLLTPVAIALLQTGDQRFAMTLYSSDILIGQLVPPMFGLGLELFQCAWMLCQLMDAFRIGRATPLVHSADQPVGVALTP